MSQQDDIKAFNQYCAEVMGYTYWIKDGKVFIDGFADSVNELKFYSNLNQLAEVFDKLMCTDGLLRNHERFTEIFNDREPSTNKGIATAMREFIWSTHD